MITSLGVVLSVHCRMPDRVDSPSKEDAPPTATSAQSLSPALAAFRDQLFNADDTQWRQLDMPNLRMRAALGQVVVRDMDYPQYVQQLDNADADIRADGLCGVAASKSRAAVDHLARALRSEPDPYNRTIAVWCLRSFESDRRVADALMRYLTDCRDIDLGRCLAEDGSIQDFRSPFPLAAFEAFKALASIRGKDDMLRGAGWRAFAARAERHVRPEPISVLNLDRLRGQAGQPRSDPAANARKWIDEMRE